MVSLILVAIGTSACSTSPPPSAPLPSTPSPMQAVEGFPLNPGTYWIYKGTVKWQDGLHTSETSVTWRMEVVRSQRVGRYEVSVLLGHPEDLAWFTPGKPRGGHIIVRDEGKYYDIHSELDPATLLSDETNLRAKLNPDALFLELPLQSGTCLGKDPEDKRTGGMNCWSVGTPAAAVLANIKGIPTGGAYSEYELAYRSNPDHTLIHFVPGIGITTYVYEHHGSVSEADVHLVEYHPG